MGNWTVSSLGGWGRGLMGVLIALALITRPSLADAQVQQGATMTVLRGQVAVIKADGSAVQPAPSGTLIGPGDEIRTLTATGALITFFAGSEIEMGAETILVVDRVSQDGTKIDISLKQVLGSTISRVQSLADPTSAYRVEAGGAVAVVRGSTLAARGPETTPSGTFVSIACTGCSAVSYVQDLLTGEQAPLGPQTFGYTWPVRSGGATGVKDGAFDPFRVDLSAGLENAVAEAITTAEQREQSDTRGGPPGLVAAGGRQQRSTSVQRIELEAEDDDRPNQGPPDQGTTAPVIPASLLQCVTVGTGSGCTFTLTDANAPLVRTVDLRIQTTTGNESVACSRFPCSFTLAGRIFQGSRIVRILTLTNGQVVQTTSSANCNRPPGTPC